jgi:sugar phosphate isomerase/epimerase
MQLGVNSVLFGGLDVEEAFRYTALANYDAIEISAIQDKEPHLILETWREIVPRLRQLSSDYNLPITAIEQSLRDPKLMESALQAAAELEIPIINFGPGGKSDVEEVFLRMLDEINTLIPLAERYGITLCLKAHVGAAVYNTPTTLRLLNEITSPVLAIDMDPSHIYRAGENPVDALLPVLARLGHIHIRDCKGRQSGPGKPEMQANGRGDIDLLGYFALLHQSGYTGPVNLEIINALEYPLEQRCMIAAESRGHMQACLQACGAR